MATINPYLNFAGNTEEAEKFSNGLSKGGKVTMTLADTFWEHILVSLLINSEFSG